MSIEPFIDRRPMPRTVVLDLPVPPSVNQTRRADWAHASSHRKWMLDADKHVLAAKCRQRDPVRLDKFKGQYEVSILLDETQTNIDLDNGLKALIDYLHRIDLTVDDNKKYLRRIVLEWGSAPAGCRIAVRELADAR